MSMELESNKKVLIISSCCFSKSESNGKTMESLFSFMPSDKLAQFYVKDFDPDRLFCDDYFRVTDKDMLKCFVRASGGKLYDKKIRENRKVKTASIPQKNAFRLLIRQFVWSLNVWRIRTGYKEWVKQVAPDVVFYMVGENTFMMKIAMVTSKWTGAPLLVFNTEGYYYAQHNYFPSSSFLGKLSFNLFLKRYKRTFQELMSKTSHVIYNCEKLENDYSREFKLPSTVLYTSSSIKVTPYCPKKDLANLRISYIGTLGLGRHTSLIQIGKVLSDYQANLAIHVFGSCKREIADQLCAAQGVEYKGLVPFDQVVEEIDNSDILVHIESFDPFYTDVIKYGFTTKIADSLMAGRCFFVYAPSYVACYDYIHSFNPQCVASSYSEMKEKLIALITDSRERQNSAALNKELALRNHSVINNADKLKRILTNL